MLLPAYFRAFLLLNVFIMSMLQMKLFSTVPTTLYLLKEALYSKFTVSERIKRIV